MDVKSKAENLPIRKKKVEEENRSWVTEEKISQYKEYKREKLVEETSNRCLLGETKREL